MYLPIAGMAGAPAIVGDMRSLYVIDFRLTHHLISDDVLLVEEYFRFDLSFKNIHFPSNPGAKC
jgi:hypothetical protein